MHHLTLMCTLHFSHTLEVPPPHTIGFIFHLCSKTMAIFQQRRDLAWIVPSIHKSFAYKVCNWLLCLFILKKMIHKMQYFVFFSSLEFFFSPILVVNYDFLFSFHTACKTRWDWIIMFVERLNIGAHLPCAVKEALAGAAAFSHTIWIKPKSRRALPIRLALPAIVTAKIKQKQTKKRKRITSWHDKHCYSK